MQLIEQKDAEKLREHLEKELVGPVTIDLYTRPSSKIVVPGREECPFCEETQQLLEEIAALSDRITLVVHDVGAERPVADAMGATEVPTIVLSGGAKGKVRFVGIPSGYEFATLLEGLVNVSRGSTSLTDATREALRGLKRQVHIRVFVTPTCPYCPRAALIAHEMAIESELVAADVVEVQEFPEMADRYKVRGVPKIVVDDRIEMLGAQPEEKLLEAVLQAAA